MTLNFVLVTNLTTISGLLAGFCITIVIELIIEEKLKTWRKETGEAAEQTTPPEIDWASINPQKQNIFKRIFGVLTNPEKNNSIAIFAFLFSAIFLITASVSGAIISGHENSAYEKLLLSSMITVFELAIGFLCFFFGTWLMAIKTKKWIAIAISIVILISITWIVVVYFYVC